LVLIAGGVLTGVGAEEDEYDSPNGNVTPGGLDSPQPERRASPIAIVAIHPPGNARNGKSRD
jgi:hypothetical protein